MNPFRQLLGSARRQPPIGTWIMSASPLVAEAVGHAGFDWGVIDMEHSPLELGGAVHLLQAVGNTKMVPVLRVPWNDAVTVKRVLDAGASTVMFPFVQNAEEAALAVAATRYPPEGRRGLAGMSRATRFGTAINHVAHANRDVGVIVQIESMAAVDAIEAIAAVPGVDALFLGPADLSADMGLLGELMHPKVMDVMARAAQRCAALGKPAGTVGGNVAEVARYRAAGYTFVAVGSDLGLLVGGAQAALHALRGQAGEATVHTLATGTLAD